MSRTHATTPGAIQALGIVQDLQAHFVKTLEGIRADGGPPTQLERVEWLRAGGTCGGGERYGSPGNEVFNRASINVSQVHYEGDPDKKLGSATALSAIVHPKNPFAPSIHVHVSWTEYKSGKGYWRIMADLNPAIEDDGDTETFESALRDVAPDVYERACEEGLRYFSIPSLDRHRGVAHFYLESYSTEDPEADQALAIAVIRSAIDTYGGLVQKQLQQHPAPGEDDRLAQLAYHTVYLFQVLTLDRGTTAGLLVHDENDLGILGSLPALVDRELLHSWHIGVPAPQDELVLALDRALGDQNPAPVDDDAKQRFAQVIREHYGKHPDALELQASASTRPPSVENHR